MFDVLNENYLRGSQVVALQRWINIGREAYPFYVFIFDSPALKVQLIIAWGEA